MDGYSPINKGSPIGELPYQARGMLEDVSRVREWNNPGGMDNYDVSV
jgi:hypothetical protein